VSPCQYPMKEMGCGQCLCRAMNVAHVTRTSSRKVLAKTSSQGPVPDLAEKIRAGFFTRAYMYLGVKLHTNSFQDVSGVIALY
jgi:hypothetical protein